MPVFLLLTSARLYDHYDYYEYRNPEEPILPKTSAMLYNKEMLFSRSGSHVDDYSISHALEAAELITTVVGSSPRPRNYKH